MSTRQNRKAEWLNCCGLHYSVEDRWLRDNIAALFDIEQPNDVQKKLIGAGEMYVYLMDLPGGAWPSFKEKEPMAMAMAEFGPSPAQTK